MMNAPSIDIRDFLVAIPELNLVVGDNIHIGKQPTQPNSVVTLYDTGGQPIPDLCKSIYEYKQMQVKVRDVNYIDGWNTIQAIVDQLNAQSNIEINGTYYAGILVTSGPEQIEYDDKNRIIFIINLEIQRR